MQTELNIPDLNRKLARVVASSWLDPSYKEKVLNCPKEAFAEAGIPLPDSINLVVTEDTATHRNIILADKPLPPQNTITSLPANPDFYSAYSYVYSKALSDKGFKSEFLANPAGTLRSLGVALPPDTTVAVHQDTETNRYFTLPMTPKSRITIELNEQNLGVLDATAVNANVNVNANVQANVNADVNVNAAAQVNGAAVATVVVAVAVLI